MKSRLYHAIRTVAFQLYRKGQRWTPCVPPTVNLNHTFSVGLRLKSHPIRFRPAVWSAPVCLPSGVRRKSVCSFHFSTDNLSTRVLFRRASAKNIYSEYTRSVSVPRLYDCPYVFCPAYAKTLPVPFPPSRTVFGSRLSSVGIPQ